MKETNTENKPIAFNKQEALQEFGERLKWLRVQLKMSQRDFAKKLGIVPSYVSELETGKSGAGFELMHKLTKAYSINPLYLYSGEGPKFLDRFAPEPSDSVKQLVGYDFGHNTDMIMSLLDDMEQSQLVLYEILREYRRTKLKNKELISRDIEEFQLEKSVKKKEAKKKDGFRESGS